MHNRKRFFWEVITLIIWIILTTLAWSLPVGWTKPWQMSIFWTSNSEWPTTDKSCGESIIRDGYRVKYMKFGFSYVINILDSLSITKYILSTVYVSCRSIQIRRPKFLGTTCYITSVEHLDRFNAPNTKVCIWEWASAW